MKIGLLLLFMITGVTASRGQGTILFGNLVPGLVDARFSYLLVPFGPGWTAHLLVAQDTQSPFLSQVPTTTFKTSTEAEFGYLNSVVVAVPGLPPGSVALAEIQLIQDTNEMCRARSGFVRVTLGNGVDGAAPLIGLEAFDFTPGVECIPEPSLPILLVAGAAICLARRRVN